MTTAKDDDGEYDDSIFRAALFGPVHPVAALNGGLAFTTTAPLDGGGGGRSSSGSGGSGYSGEGAGTASSTGILLTVCCGGGASGHYHNLVIRKPQLFENKIEKDFLNWVIKLQRYFSVIQLRREAWTETLLLYLGTEPGATARYLGVNDGTPWDEARRKLVAHFSPKEQFEEVCARLITVSRTKTNRLRSSPVKCVSQRHVHFLVLQKIFYSSYWYSTLYRDFESH